MNDKEKVLTDSRVQKLGDKMVTTRRENKSLNTSDDTKFLCENVQNNPHYKICYLYRKDLTEMTRNPKISIPGEIKVLLIDKKRNMMFDIGMCPT